MRRLASVVLTGVLLTACGDAFSPGGVSGTYNLESINGNPLPAESELPGVFTADRTVIAAGSVTLNADGTYSVSLTWEITEQGITTTDPFTDSGTFTLVEPSTIRFAEAGGSETTGTLDGDRLTITAGDFSFVYRK